MGHKDPAVSHKMTQSWVTRDPHGSDEIWRWQLKFLALGIKFLALAAEIFLSVLAPIFFFPSTLFPIINP
jgi:hypothetical protein